ncbi:unnamed protein product [Toxocara canis]|uniref:DUF1768 domain-containing protein n=1 Tax=Toxocara canis TaxID=6265 RepID=A0A183VCD9_TOXCA|nr:unnamed protein product [Toxocara canis]
MRRGNLPFAVKEDFDVSSLDPSEVYVDYDKIGKNFILVGAFNRQVMVPAYRNGELPNRVPYQRFPDLHSPCSASYIRGGILFQSLPNTCGSPLCFSFFRRVDVGWSRAGRRYTVRNVYRSYQMAEYFNDTEAMKKILAAKSNREVEKVTNQIDGFDHASWNQRLKFEQTDWIAKLLVCTGNSYIAVAEPDKVFGTGWYKYRYEADKPIYWDGENRGGKFLMKLRHELKRTHKWASAEEEKVERFIFFWFCSCREVSNRSNAGQSAPVLVVVLSDLTYVYRGFGLFGVVCIVVGGSASYMVHRY